MSVSPPESEQQLLYRALQLAGKNLQYLADQSGVGLPEDLVNAKGLVGRLLEQYLGATAGSLPEPDFREIGVELKTIPVNRQGQPGESTFVCTVSLLPGEHQDWEHSLVRNKLSRVLWMPVESDRNIPVYQRRIGTPILWSPTPDQENELRTDWNELVDLVMTGNLDQVSSHLGKCLQIRPKAQNAKSLHSGIGPDGNLSPTLPRGFYLRAGFTRTILGTR